MSRTAFLDLNGTLVAPITVDRVGELQPLPDAAAAVARLCGAGFRCPVVTVQSRIAKGAFSEAEFRTWFRDLAQLMAREGARLEGPYVCPHRFSEPCPCRKPSTMLYERAVKENGLSLDDAVVIGDSAADMEAAARLGARGCLVRSGWAASEDEVARASPWTTMVAGSLTEAADWLLGRSAA